MKYTINGFSQQRALEFKKEIEKRGKTTTLKLDCIDLMLLRWFVDFFPRMTKKNIKGKEYAWVNYTTVIEDLPLLDLEKKSIYNRFKKLAEFGILEHKHIKDGGSYSFYGFGINYQVLIDTSGNGERGMTQISEGVGKNIPRGRKKISEGVGKKFPNKDSSIKNNLSINNSNNIYCANSENEQKKSSIQKNEAANTVGDYSTKLKENQVRHKYGEYENVLLSDKEYEKLVNEFPLDYQDRIEQLSEYIASTGKKYKNFLATIRSWAKREQKGSVSNATVKKHPKRDGSEFAEFS